jgi:hypothetical protein
VSRATELWKQAGLCRRAASVPTKGGHRVDRILLAVAEGLERKAEALEGRAVAHAVASRAPD